MTSLGDQNIIVKWNGLNPKNQTLEKWFIRGISAKGCFYGERRVPFGDASKVILTEGKLLEKDNKELRNLVKKIYDVDPQIQLDSQSFTGLIALGPIAKATNIVEYSEERHRGLVISDKFKRVIEILASYMSNE